ncbi:MAG: MoaD/ThiS family protein [Anaerolineales bacterium]
MTARLHLRDQEFKVRSGMTIRSALLRLNIQPEAGFPTRDGELLTDDEILLEGDEIRLIAVISGGSN